jgi:hypothetical protein
MGMDEHQIATLAALPEMEWRTSSLRLISGVQDGLNNNTEITTNIEEVINRDVLPMRAKIDAMYEAYEFAREGWAFLAKVGRVLASVGRGVAWVIDFGGRLAKPLFWIIAIVAAAGTWYKTGTWTMPEWWGWFLK